VLHQGDLVIRN